MYFYYNLGEKRFLKLCGVLILQNVHGDSNIIVSHLKEIQKKVVSQAKVLISQ